MTSSDSSGISDDEIEELQRFLQSNRDSTPEIPRRSPISSDHSARVAVVEWLREAIEASDVDEVTISAQRIAEKVDASPKEVGSVMFTINSGEVDGLSAKRRGSNQRAKKWRVWEQ